MAESSYLLVILGRGGGDMAPKDESQRGKEEENKTGFIGPEDPGLEHADCPQDDAADDNAFDQVKGLLGQMMAVARRRPADEPDVSTKNHKKTGEKSECLGIHYRYNLSQLL